ncbi:hypothetical protein J6590_082533 [Homalodisca vitripennis]|nr:hypothetical protein J6590_082533 [Homalodisca vitripennis]
MAVFQEKVQRVLIAQLQIYLPVTPGEMLQKTHFDRNMKSNQVTRGSSRRDSPPSFYTLHRKLGEIIKLDVAPQIRSALTKAASDC